MTICFFPYCFIRKSSAFSCLQVSGEILKSAGEIVREVYLNIQANLIFICNLFFSDSARLQEEGGRQIHFDKVPQGISFSSFLDHPSS